MFFCSFAVSEANGTLAGAPNLWDALVPQPLLLLVQAIAPGFAAPVGLYFDLKVEPDANRPSLGVVQEITANVGQGIFFSFANLFPALSAAAYETTYSALSNLPADFRLDQSTGLLSGTPTAQGKHSPLAAPNRRTHHSLAWLAAIAARPPCPYT